MSKLFDDAEEDGLTIDPEDIIEIDTDRMAKEAFDYAAALIDNLEKICADKDLMASMPNLKEHIDKELDSMANLLKMRFANEELHDMLVRTIGKNPANASLYSNLVKIQQSTLKIQQQLDTIVDRLKKSLKAIQLEFNFNAQTPEEQIKESDGECKIKTTKGSKDFIQQMKELNLDDIDI